VPSKAHAISPVVAGVAATVMMTAVMEFARRNGVLRRRPPEEITNRMLACGGPTKVTPEQLMNPRRRFRWL
jgi:hypothetical protein